MDFLSEVLKDVTSKKTIRFLKELLVTMPQTAVQNSRIKIYKPGSLLISSGDISKTVYILLDGTVNVSYELPNGIIYSFAKFEAPSFLGEIEAFAQYPSYRGTVSCETGCKLLALPKVHFLIWMQNNNQALFTVTASITRKITKQYSRDRAFLFFSGESRLAYQLTQYYEREAINSVCNLEIQRYQLADETCLSIKTINRSISRLKEKKLIGQSGRIITITKEQYENLLEMLRDSE